MQILTPSGYKDAEEIVIGDEVSAFDGVTGEPIINTVEDIQRWTWGERTIIVDYNTDIATGDLIPIYETYTTTIQSKFIDGEWVEFVDTQDNFGAFTFYKINDSINLYKNQSVWCNDNYVKHAFELEIGDIIYDENDEPVEITSLEEVTDEIFYWFKISGDHSYIANGFSLHNASRFWVGGGATANWNATSNTNWSATSGGSNNATVPGSSDDVTFNSSGNSSSTISAIITILSFTVVSGYTSTITHNAVLTVAGSVTLVTGYTIAGSSNMTISAASTITTNTKVWPNGMLFSGANTKTLGDNLSITGLLTISTSSNTVITSNILTVAGGLNLASSISGTVAFVLTGGTLSSSQGFSATSFTITGTVNISGSPTFSNTTLDVSGVTALTQTAGQTITWGGTALTYVGSVNATIANLLIGGTCNPTLNTSPLLVSGTLSTSGGGQTWAGNVGFVVGTFAPGATSVSTMTFQNSITYRTTTAFTSNTSRIGSILTITSNHATLRANFTLDYGATCNVLGHFIRIDASAGRTIWSFNGTITDSPNIKTFTQPNTVSY